MRGKTRIIKDYDTFEIIPLIVKNFVQFLNTLWDIINAKEPVLNLDQLFLLLYNVFLWKIFAQSARPIIFELYATDQQSNLELLLIRFIPWLYLYLSIGFIFLLNFKIFLISKKHNPQPNGCRKKERIKDIFANLWQRSPYVGNVTGKKASVTLISSKPVVSPMPWQARTKVNGEYTKNKIK